MGCVPFVKLGDYVQEEGLKTGASLFREVDGLRLRFWDRGTLSLRSGNVANCPIRQPWAKRCSAVEMDYSNPLAPVKCNRMARAECDGKCLTGWVRGLGVAMLDILCISWK